MTKEEYAEFHKYLAMLIYEYNQSLVNMRSDSEMRCEIIDILQALEKVMKICIVDERTNKNVMVNKID